MSQILATNKKILRGTVVSSSMDKTVTVEVQRFIKDAKYGKYHTRSKKYKAHDEENQYSVGQTVEIEASRPFSKTKSFIVKGLVKEEDK